MEWINRYLDQERVRGAADTTLRSYAHDLLHFLRWWSTAHKTSGIARQDLTESTFLDYILLALKREDVQLSESQIRVPGKGKKTRVLPLDRDSAKLLDHCLCLERPAHCGQALFVSLKGPSPRQPDDTSGSAFPVSTSPADHGRHEGESPRFRHTFASDMIRAGISLPALMQLMGHA